MPIGVSDTRCGGLPSRGASVVPFRTIAPTSRFENPSTRVYSSPKPTQPESSTMGEANFSPQKSRRERTVPGAGGRYPRHSYWGMFHVVLL